MGIGGSTHHRAIDVIQCLEAILRRVQTTIELNNQLWPPLFQLQDTFLLQGWNRSVLFRI
tara:strand:- start:31 stop:210 length:180 start_codon:yes stop_codon:yes gene_type:complete